VFEYDPTGSLTNILRDLGEAGRRAAWSLSPGNRLIATDRARYVNDGRGRRIRRAEPADGEDPRARAPRGDERVTTYGWDTKDRLREVVMADGARVRFTYDAFGRRVRKDVLPASPAPALLGGPSGATPEARAVKRTVTFLWDGDVLCEEQDSSKSSVARKRIHVHEPGTFIPLIQSEQGEVFGVINDHLGMPKELVDESGRIAWRAQHGAWGDLREVERDRGAAAVQSPFRLLGHYFDEETSLSYTRFRYFCAEHGRWLSSDPLGIVGGLNLHAFDGSPSAVVDPWGLAPELDPKECMNPKDINFSQRSINRRFDTPNGKIPMQTAINAGPEQVKSFPPIPVMIVKGQVVALNGNSRLLIAQETGAPLIRVQIVSGPEAYRELAKRTRDNGLPITGTREQPTPR
jgi:RHS repeat-associated protein